MMRNIFVRPFHVDLIFSSAKFVFVGLFIWQIVVRVPILSGDTQALATSSQALVECLRDGQLNGCPGALQFGVTQYLPAMILAWRGVEPYSIVVVLTLLNVLSFIAIVYVALKNPLARRNHYAMLVITIVGSPLIAYSAYSFSEGLLGLTVILSLYCVITGRRIGYAATTCLAIGSRETAFVSMSLLLLAMYLLSENDKRVSLRVLLSGIAMGISTVIAFNVFKFGTWNNAIHSDPSLRTTEIPQILRSLGGLLFSPNGGLILFWPAAVAVFVLATIRGTKRWLLHSDHKIGVILILTHLAIATQLLGLASWYAPFGWVSWGPRLMIPTTIGVLIVSLYLLDRLAKDQDSERFPQLEAEDEKFFNMVLVLGAIGLIAALGFLQEPGAVLSWFGRTDSTCPLPAVIQLDRDYYFKCLNHGMWRTDGSILETSMKSFSGLVPGLTLGLYLFLARSGRSFRLPVNTQIHCGHEK